MKTRDGLRLGFGPSAMVVLLVMLWTIGFLPHTAHAQLRPEQQVYVPLIAAYDVAATPVPALVTGDQVYGLVGTLESAQGRIYANYLVTRDGTFALAGQTPELEAEISTLAETTGTEIKVWGEIVPDSGGTEPLIVVTGILGPRQTPVATPAPIQGASTPIAIVKFDLVNLRARPDTNAERVGEVTLNQACDIVGRNQLSTWWEIDCADGQRGWIDGRLVDVQGSTDSVEVVDLTQPIVVAQPVTPTPTPIPTPVVQVNGWRAEFYPTVNLSGAPEVVMDVGTINFDWGLSAPTSTLPVDGFSARFERTINFTPAFYQLTARTDDGVRVWLDDTLIIDEWHGATNQTYSVGRVLSGSHQIRVEYYEASGTASLRFDYSITDQTPVWQADYYPGVVPDGSPLLSRTEPRSQNPLDYNWSSSSPEPESLGIDFWSARWEGSFYFDSGNYVFRINADDGVRVYIDGLRVIDQWRDGYKEASNQVLGVGGGDHYITVEYYERSGAASIRLWWYRDSAYTGPQ